MISNWNDSSNSSDSESDTDIATQESSSHRHIRGPTPGVSRGAYAKISTESKRRLVEAYESGTDWTVAARTLNIKEPTARSIIVRYQEEGSLEDPRGGRREQSIKMTDEVVDRCVSMIESKPDITLKAIKEKLATEDPPVMISESSIARGLDGRLITIKKLQVCQQIMTAN